MNNYHSVFGYINAFLKDWNSKWSQREWELRYFTCKVDTAATKHAARKRGCIENFMTSLSYDSIIKSELYYCVISIYELTTYPKWWWDDYVVLKRLKMMYKHMEHDQVRRSKKKLYTLLWSLKFTKFNGKNIWRLFFTTINCKLRVISCIST